MPSQPNDQRIASNGQPSEGVTILRNFILNNPLVESVVYHFIDLSGIIRCQLTPIHRALSIALDPHDGLSIPANISNAGGVDDFLHTELVTRGKDIAIPDWSSLFVCPNSPQRAVVNCFVNEEEAGFSRCLRTAVKQLVDKTEKSISHAATFLIGFEVEFYLISSADADTPMNTPGTLFSVAGVRHPMFEVVEDAVRMIENAGIRVWKFHPEGSHGCYEISTAPLPPLQAIDALHYTREAIRSTAAAKGFYATMHPKPYENVHGCGLHMHISMSSPDGRRQTKEVADSFLAGLLQSTPALCGLGMPNYDSYSRNYFRLNRQWVTWGNENRLAAIREIGQAHWEIRKVDSMCNIYLALLGFLGVGLAAVERRAKLNIKPLLSYNMETKLEEAERAELGVTTELPSTLKEALEHLENDTHVRDAVGQQVWERYIYVKKAEEERFAKMTRRDRILTCLKNF